MSSTSTPVTKRAADPRPARTRAAIIAAAESLGKEGAELNVSAIVKEAGLSRSSFYSQFKDVGDIAVQLIGEFLAELLSRGQSIRAAGGSTDQELVQHIIEDFLTEFHERRFLYSALLNDSSDSGCQNQVCNLMTQLSLPAFVRHAPSAENPNYDAEFTARFVAAGTLANIIAWVSSEHPVAIEEMKQRVYAALPAWVLKLS